MAGTKVYPMEFIVDWPGWGLSDNRFGEEFDEEARVRMIVGGRKLLPFILKNKQVLKSSLLEIGPFFSPLLNSKEVNKVLAAGTSVTFLENDPFAVSWLQEQQFRVLNIDINGASFNDMLFNEVLANKLNFPETFNGIVLSQVLNYVNPAKLFSSLAPFLNQNGLLFINNVINYGIPPLFSENRPTCNEDVKAALLQCGFQLVEKVVLPKEFDKESDEGRLIIVASKCNISD